MTKEQMMAHKTQTQLQKAIQDGRRGGRQTAQKLQQSTQEVDLAYMSETVVRRKLRLMCAKDPALKDAYCKYLQDYNEVRATYNDSYLGLDGRGRVSAG